MPRPPVKATEKLAKAKRLGELRAESQVHRNKPIAESVREHIGKMIDNVNPLQLIATTGLAILIHDFILNSENFAAQVKSGDKGAIASMLSKGALEILATGAGMKLRDIIGTNELVLWVVSFAIAYIVVTQGGAMIGMLETGIAKIVPLFFGA